MKCSIHAVIALVAVFLAPLLTAQCPQNDNLQWPLGCCTPSAANVPVFPALTLNGQGACIRDCGVESQFNTLTTIAPTQILCDIWLMAISITTPTFTASTPIVVAKYDRTWVEFPLPGTPPIQVWRFLVNGDFVYAPTTAAGVGCPIPLSALPPNSLPVHFVGNVDYAFNCGTGNWEIAYTLTHFCPTEMNAPFSARPIAGSGAWPKRTYHFVGPANFAFAPCPPPDGVIIADTSRTSLGLTTPVPYTCLREDPIPQGVLTNVFQNCVCFDPTPVGPPNRYMHQNLNAIETCAGAGAPIISFPFFGVGFMPTGLRALMLGSYLPVAAPTYPGPECISVYLGILESPGVCVAPTTAPVLHIVTGIGTTGGFGVQLFDQTAIPIAPLDFLDLQQMLVLTPFGFVPGLGALFASERIWSFNML